MQYLETKSEGTIGTITLNHPEKRNALSTPLVDAIVETLDGFARERIRVVVLRAPPGMRIWSSGHDVRELPEGGRDPVGWDDPLRYLVRAIEECARAGDRHDRGWSVGRSLRSGFCLRPGYRRAERYAAVTPARLAAPYNVMLPLLNACSARIVKEMAFTARPVSAERAERLGIRRMPYLLDLSGATMAI